jgi:hypothetical protein
MSFFSKPIPGLKPADSITISLATGIGVAALYAQNIGPMSDVHMTNPGDLAVNTSIKKSGWQSLALVTAITVMTRDINVAYIGGAMIILEHVMYLHADLASPANGEISVTPEAYQPAGVAAGSNEALQSAYPSLAAV